MLRNGAGVSAGPGHDQDDSPFTERGAAPHCRSSAHPSVRTDPTEAVPMGLLQDVRREAELPHAPHTTIDVAEQSKIFCHSFSKVIDGFHCVHCGVSSECCMAKFDDAFDGGILSPSLNSPFVSS